MIKEISDADILEARKVLEAHVVPASTREAALESLHFCIVSQGFTWEKASEFIYRIRDKSNSTCKNPRSKLSSLDVLTNKEIIHKIEKDMGLRFHHNQRFDPAIDYFLDENNFPNMDEIINADSEIREKYKKEIKYLGRKTFSFWHLCLGGKNLIALDVHVMRGLSNLGLEIPEEYYTSFARTVGTQKVRKTPGKKDYLEIESAAQKMFSKDPRFIYGDGKVDMALVDSILWWKGAKRNNQELLPGFDSLEEHCKLPYSKEVLKL